MVVAGWWKLRGYRVLTTDAESWDRRKTCDVCPHLMDGFQCGVCSCLVDAKAALTSEACPVGHWKRIRSKRKHWLR